MSITSGSGGPFVAPPQPAPPVAAGGGGPQKISCKNFPKTASAPINILQMTTPNDGQSHTVILAAVKNVQSNETGGALSLQWTEGGFAMSFQVDAGGQAAANGYQLGGITGGPQAVIVDPGTSVALVQTNNLSAGASTITASLLIF